MADEVTELPKVLSTQGEQHQETGYIKASDEDVDLYVDRVTDEVLACRERGRHLFPTIRQAGIHFSEVDSDGLFIRRLTCTCCELAVKVEKWEGTRQRGRTRFNRVDSQLEYRTGQDGQTYLSPTGRGRMTPRQIGDSEVGHGGFDAPGVEVGPQELQEFAVFVGGEVDFHAHLVDVDLVGFDVVLGAADVAVSDLAGAHANRLSVVVLSTTRWESSCSSSPRLVIPVISSGGLAGAPSAGAASAPSVSTG
ncbi:hypothetical protein [Saccharopolyspora sp. NPDC049426]|uniref:hypothetical protein n=1 Tax=Saccharopolyspora sp. NPDC049426 TaxID=3155652 RepID=UPI00342385C9